MKRPPPARVVALAAAVAVAGCSAPEPSLPLGSFPLAELADTARWLVETDAIDFGEPQHRPALWSGWGADEKYPEGTFVWGAGEKSRLSFEVVEPRDRSLRLRGWSYPFGDAPPQEVRFEIGGKEIGRRKLGPTPGWIELDLPGEAVNVGENFLELRYARHLAGPLPWAAGWDSLRLGGARAGGKPRLERGADRFILPARSGVEWTFELGGDSWLAWKNLGARGGAELAVAIADEEGRREDLPRARGGRLRLTAPGEPNRLRTISLRALGEGGEVRLSGLRIYAPDLAAPPARATTSTAAPPTVGGDVASGAAAAPPNILLYLVDTLRSDHLGCYGYPKPTTPAIDAFAKGAVRFREARAQASWTRPAIATILTGLYPVTHKTQRTQDVLSARYTTLAEILRDAGWQTAMITANGNVSRRFGFGQGFGHFQHLTERPKLENPHVTSGQAHAEALKWLDRRDPAKPFFLFVHTADPHDPYTPPRPFREKFAPDVVDRSIGTRRGMERVVKLPPAEAAAQRSSLVALYDGEIAANDHSFGQLLGELRRRGLEQSTVVLFTADHGEEFFEHGGWKHGQTLYEEQLRIPLLLRLPDERGAGRVVAEPVEQIDIAPTLLALAERPVPPELPGRSLLSLVDGGGRSPSGHVFYAWLETRGIALGAAMRSDWKLIQNRIPAQSLRQPPFELYSLGSDAEEKHDLALGRSLRRKWLESQLARGFARFDSLHPAEQTDLDPELRKTLEALGYL